MLEFGGRQFSSRLIIGTAGYPSPEVMKESIQASGAEIVTVSLRRQSPGSRGGQAFWELIRSCGVAILPNTAGCHSVKEAVTTAHMARDLFGNSWIKLETIGDDYTLQPDLFALVEAAEILIEDGFEVFPYMTEDLTVAHRLQALGCRILMPWGSPIGSGLGLANPHALKTLRARTEGMTLVLDAGIGAPSHASQAMEMGFDCVLLNTAISNAQNPPLMARAFKLAVEAGRAAYESGLMVARDMAKPSTPVLGTPFWHEAGESERQGNDP